MTILLGKDVDRMLRGLPLARSEYIKNSVHMTNIAKKFGFPLVLKIVSPKVIHKTEMKAIRIVNNEAELRKAYADIDKKAKSLKGKILAQEFIRGKELII